MFKVFSGIVCFSPLDAITHPWSPVVTTKKVKKTLLIVSWRAELSLVWNHVYQQAWSECCKGSVWSCSPCPPASSPMPPANVCLLSTSLALPSAPQSRTRLRGTSGSAQVSSSWHFNEEITGPLHPHGDLSVLSGICRGLMPLCRSQFHSHGVHSSEPEVWSCGCLLSSSFIEDAEFMFLCSVLLNFDLFKEGIWTEISLFCGLHLETLIQFYSRYHSTMRDWERESEPTPAH